jgi:hypothetical protein
MSISCPYLSPRERSEAEATWHLVSQLPGDRRVLDLAMPPGSRFRRRDSDVSDKPVKPNVLTRSPPSSPQTSEPKSHPRDPYPVPSNNPASQYTLLEKLGTGSFGTVYKAMHNETKQIVAIKQIGELIIHSCWILGGIVIMH